jgi:hydrogenase expression/formation protein HypE
MIEIASEEAIRHGACESALCISTRSIVRSCKGGADVLLRNRVCVANEGKLIAIVSADLAHALVARMKQNKYGAGASIIGEVKAEPAGTVSMRTAFGGTRIVNMLVGEQLPRIC